MTMCMVEGCGNDSEIRGICKTCYSSARNLVRSNKATWEELEQLGLCNPTRTRKSLFNKAFGGKENESTRSLGQSPE